MDTQGKAVVEYVKRDPKTGRAINVTISMRYGGVPKFRATFRKRLPRPQRGWRVESFNEEFCDDNGVTVEHNAHIPASGWVSMAIVAAATIFQKGEE